MNDRQRQDDGGQGWWITRERDNRCRVVWACFKLFLISYFFLTKFFICCFRYSSTILVSMTTNKRAKRTLSWAFIKVMSALGRSKSRGQVPDECKKITVLSSPSSWFFLPFPLEDIQEMEKAASKNRQQNGIFLFSPSLYVRSGREGKRGLWINRGLEMQRRVLSPGCVFSLVIYYSYTNEYLETSWMESTGNGLRW